MLLAPVILAVRGLVVFLQYNFYAAAYMNLRSVREGKDNTDGIEEKKLLKFGQLSHITLVLLAAFYLAPMYAVVSTFLVGLGISLLYSWPYLNKVVLPYLKSAWNNLMIAALCKWPSLKKLLLPLVIPSKPASGQEATLSRFARFQRIYLKFIIPVFTYLPLLVMVAAIYFNAPLFFFAALAGLVMTYLERTNKLPSRVIDIKETIFNWLKLPILVYRWIFLDLFSKIVQGIMLVFSTLSSWTQAIKTMRKPKEKDYAALYAPEYLQASKTQAEKLDVTDRFDENSPQSTEKQAAEDAKAFFIRTFLLVSDRDLKDYLFTTRSHFWHTLDVGVDPKAKIKLQMTEEAYSILFPEAEGIPYEQYLLDLKEADAFQSFCIEQAVLSHQEKNPEKVNLFPKDIDAKPCDRATKEQLYDYLEKNPAIARQLIARFVRSLQKTLVSKVKYDQFNNLKREGVLKIKKAIQNTLDKIHKLKEGPTADTEHLRRFYIVGILAEMTKCTNNGVIMAEHVLGTPHLTPEQKLTHCLNERRNINFDTLMQMLLELKAGLIEKIGSQSAMPSTPHTEDPELKKLYAQKAQEKARLLESCLNSFLRGYDNNHDRAYWRHLLGPFLGLHHALTEYDMVEKEESFGPALFEFFNFLLNLDEVTPNLYKYPFYDLPEIKAQFDLEELNEYLRAHYTKVLSLAKCDAEKIPAMVDQIRLAIFEEFGSKNFSPEEQIRRIVTFMAVQEGFVYWDIEKRKYPRWEYLKSYFGADKPLRSVITTSDAPPVTSLNDLLSARISHFPKRKAINRLLVKGEALAQTLSLCAVKISRR